MLFSEHRNAIHRFVEVRAGNCGLAGLHKSDNETFVRTSDNREEWIQIEFPGGKFVPTCYRLKRLSSSRLLSWSLQ
jgi:hypothetical protein